ncbi:MAG: DUF721 domain-containing protein [Syntrophales bacterium]|nr:DUF721 domain-containing protein [Syntrophales bacterium]
MPKRPALKSPLSVGDVIEAVLKKRKLPFVRKDRSLQLIWSRVVGETISSNTFPERVDRGVLTVRVASSAWLQELRFLKEEIILRFNEVSQIAPIENIRFLLGEIPIHNGEETKGTPLPSLKDFLTPRDKRMMESSLEKIKDPELRGILRRVMEKEIGRRRLREKRQGF